MTLLLLAVLLTISHESMSEIAKSKGFNFYPKGCYIPDQCKWVESKEISASMDLTCTDLYAKIDYMKLKNSTMLCQRTDSFMFYTMSIFFRQPHKTILNNSFELYNLTSFIRPYIWFGYTLSFTNIVGFTADLALDLKDNVMFYDGDFKVYTTKNTLIESCQDLNNTNLNTNFPLKKPDPYFSLFFINTRFEKPICPLIFETSKMRELAIRYMVNSYYKRNWIKFEEISANRRLNASIRNLQLSEFYGLDLTSKIVNQELFKNTEDFLFDGVINSIQVDLFKGYFPKLKRLQFNPIYFVDVIRKQGIGWLIEINRGLNVDFSNRTSIEANINSEVDISFRDVTALEFINDKNFHFFYDEDFCLVKDFPFHQFIVFVFDLQKFDTSCSTIWLMRYYQDFIDISPTLHYNDVLKNLTKQVFRDNSLFESCDFDSRVKICNRSNFKPPIKPKNVYGFDFMIISKFLLVAIFTPLVCLFGIVTNMLTILTITNKKNEKELKEKQYSYMAITSAINVSIFLIQIVTLINECDYPFGLFCSSIRSNIVVQYYKIVFGETISAFLRLFSNFTYIAFSINRISLIGSDQEKFIVFFSTLSIKVYLIFSFLISAAFSIIKGFHFTINYIKPQEAYPVLFHQDHMTYSQSRSVRNVSLIFAFNSLYDIISYLLFTAVQIGFDLVLFNKVRKTLNEKEAKFSSSKVAMEKKKKENEEIKRRVLTMVILYTLVNLVGKVPISIVSLNDVRLLTTIGFFYLGVNDSWTREIFRVFYSMKPICYISSGCMLFLDFGNFLYLLSISLNFFFYYKFDVKFKIAYQLVFSSKKQDAAKNKK